MERGKERAGLRTGDMKRLLGELETRRDQLMDEVAKKQGECDMVERVIKRAYEIILDVNKDEQAHEDMKAVDTKKQELIAQRKEDRKAHNIINDPKKAKVEEVMDGITNHDRTEEIQERTKEARVKRKKATPKKKTTKKADKK